MFVGVVIENFHKCRESQEQEEKVRREARHAKRLNQKRKSKPLFSNFPSDVLARPQDAMPLRLRPYLIRPGPRLALALSTITFALSSRLIVT